MKLDSLDKNVEELVRRLRETGIRPGPDLFLRILEDDGDMKRHVAVVREAVDRMSAADRPAAARR